MKNILKYISVSVIILFVSCSGDKSESEKKKSEIIEPGEIDACSILDQEAIEKIFNIKMKEPKKGRSQKGSAEKAAFSECSFESDDEDTKILLSVYIRFTPFRDEFHSTIQNVKNSFKKSGIEITNVEGPGDVTFWGGNQLHVFKGDNNYIIITLLGIGEQDQAIEKARAVATHVIGNIDSV